MEKLRRLEVLDNNIGLDCSFDIDVYTQHFRFVRLLPSSLYSTFHTIDNPIYDFVVENKYNVVELVNDDAKWKN